MKKCLKCGIKKDIQFFEKKRNVCRRCRLDARDKIQCHEYYKYRRENGKIIKNCPNCGKEFIPGKGKKNCCSDLCTFNDSINKTEDCWIWEKGKNSKGYGQIIYQGKTILSHRASYFLFKGKIPNGKMICHTCDNRKCVNPDHLFLGTAHDNTQDMMNKGRMPVGENDSKSKLTNDQVKEIRKNYFEGMQIRDLSEEYKVTFACIYDIVKYRKWKHLP